MRVKKIYQRGRKSSLFTRICEVVAVLHRADLIHRDLKSENLMIDEFGEVALLDFGLAVQFVGNGDKKGTHFNAGTIRYMPPEQAAGTQIDRLGFQADVFSLGVIGYRLFTGEFPFDLPESKALALKRVKDCPVQFDILESCNVPQSVKLAICTALQKDPNERPVQAQAFLDILKGKYPGNMPAGFYSMFFKTSDLENPWCSNPFGCLRCWFVLLGLDLFVFEVREGARDSLAQPHVCWVW